MTRQSDSERQSRAVLGKTPATGLQHIVRWGLSVGLVGLVGCGGSGAEGDVEDGGVRVVDLVGEQEGPEEVVPVDNSGMRPSTTRTPTITTAAPATTAALATTAAPATTAVPGGRIAFVRDRDGYQVIFVHDLGTGRVEQVSDNTGVAGGPVWSPDGGRIAYVSDPYVSDRDDDWEIFVYDLGSGRLEKITDSIGDDRGPGVVSGWWPYRLYE